MQLKEMRRNKQSMSEDECISILKSGTSGVLALSDSESYPYAVPLSYVYSDGKIIFHSAKQGHKIDCIAQNDKASFCVIAKDEVVPDEYTTYFESVIAFGKISVINDEDELKRLLILLADKYRPGFIEEHIRTVEKSLSRTNVLVLDIEYISGKKAIELVK